MIELTYDEAVELLDRAVEEKGANYVYQKQPSPIGSDGVCAYFHGEEPGCIIGWVLHYKGATAEDLEHFNQGVSVWGLYSTLYSEGIIAADEKTQMLLALVQGEQDRGVPWGAVVANSLGRIEVTA